MPGLDCPDLLSSFGIEAIPCIRITCFGILYASGLEVLLFQMLFPFLPGLISALRLSQRYRLNEPTRAEDGRRRKVTLNGS